MHQKRVLVPEKLEVFTTFGNNVVRQLRFLKSSLFDDQLSTSSPINYQGKTVILAKRRGVLPQDVDDLLIVGGGPSLEWAKKINTINPSPDYLAGQRRAAMESWVGALLLREEEKLPNGDIVEGFREPQIGAIHATLGHWKMSDKLATVVMPTGTGKTDTMIALMVSQSPTCLLVVVPTDALRTQISEDFLTLGILRKFDLLRKNSRFPLVGTLTKRFDRARDLEDFLNCSNVVVTTMQLLAGLSEAERELLVKRCSHLFLDEAHHVKARTWSRLRDEFGKRTTLQFTATPYRNDGQHIDGRIIFEYPIRKAQARGYFRKVRLRELWDLVNGDETVAKAAVEQLDADLAAGLDHVLMARVNHIEKADQIQSLYEKYGKKHRPVIVHSRLSRNEISAKLALLASRESRIAVCVAMFGEGFNFPSLKIAALHDIHQSLAVTIQFVGRFTRDAARLGDPTIVLNRADQKISDSVRELYAQVKSDWNELLTTLSEAATAEQIERENFYSSFTSNFTVAPIQNVRPKMSTVVYRTPTLQRWMPWKVESSGYAPILVGKVSVSMAENAAYFVTRSQEQVDWTDAKELIDQTFDLYALHWDPTTQLLYINSSDNSSVHTELAKIVAGDDVQLIEGANVFRAMAGIRRLLLRNMGINDHIRRSVRFMMLNGGDLQRYLESTSGHGREKTHVFGDGYEGNNRVTVGCSKKGRVWSWAVANDLRDWKRWCLSIGAKLINSSIVPDAFLEDAMEVRDLDQRPALHPLGIDWPTEFYDRAEESVLFEQGDEKKTLFELDIELISPDTTSPLRFRIVGDGFSAQYEINFSNQDVRYRPNGEDIKVRVGRRIWRASELFCREHPIIRYEKDSFSRGDQLLTPRQRRTLVFSSGKVQAWDWTGIDLTKESQTVKKLPNTIQRRVIETILAPAWDRNYEIVFDDDNPGEIADVVAITATDDKLFVDLFHCKFSKRDPGKRTKDLYEVCGQAQRSVKWYEHYDERLFAHLQKREKDRQRKYNSSRFEKGSLQTLLQIKSVARMLTREFRVFIVQPGLSKAELSDDQKELLAATDAYLFDTVGIELHVITS